MKQNKTTKLSSRGQTVIPQEIREQHGWRDGMRLEWTSLGEGAFVKKPTNRKKKPWGQWAREMHGLGKEAWEGIDPVKYTHDLWGD